MCLNLDSEITLIPFCYWFLVIRWLKKLNPRPFEQYRLSPRLSLVNKHASCATVMWITYTFISHEWLR